MCARWSADAVGEVVATAAGEVDDGADGVDAAGPPEGGMEAEMLGDDAAEECAEAEAGVPGDEQGGVGCASAVAVGEVDEDVLEGGIHVSVSEADDEGGAVVAPEVVDACENEVADEGDDDADRGVAGDHAAAQRAAAEDAGEDEADGEEEKEEACVADYAELLLSVDGDIGGYDAVAE